MCVVLTSTWHNTDVIRLQHRRDVDIAWGSAAAKADPVVLKAVIVNEAHHAAVSSYRCTLSHFNSGIKTMYAIKGVEYKAVNSAVSTAEHSVPIISFSTFSRHDELGLGSVFNRIVHYRFLLDMVEG